MSAALKSSRPARLLAAALGLLLIPSVALAVVAVAWAYDPTRTGVYYQFSTDVPIDAWKSAVFMPGSPVPVAGPIVWNPPGVSMGGAGQHHALTPGTGYVLRVWVRLPGSPAWELLKNQPFSTNP